MLWLQSLSLTRLASMDTFLKDCVYLNLFGLPVSRFPAALVFCAAVTAGGYAAGRAVFCRKSAVPSVKNRAARLPLPSGAHTGPLRHEGYKLLVRGGLGAALVCLLAVQIVSTRAVKPPSSEREMYYRSYSERLSWNRPRQRRTRFSTPKTSASPRCTRSLSRPPPRRAGTRSCSSS